MSTSASLSSFHSPPDDLAQPRSESSLGRNRAMSNSSGNFAHGAVMIDHGDSSHALGRSYGDDSSSISSPTRRTFFGRERKASNTSMSRSTDRSMGTAARAALNQAPLLRRGLRQDSAGSNYSFSKSQSDLHTRPDFPSPASGTIDLPRVAEDAEQGTQPSNGMPLSRTGLVSSRDSGMLRSPQNFNQNFSRSVDDLSRSHTPSVPAQQLPGSSPHLLPQQHRGVWGEQGVATTDRDRASETVTLAPSARRTEWLGSSPGQGVPLSTSNSFHGNFPGPHWTGSGSSTTPETAVSTHKFSRTAAKTAPKGGKGLLSKADTTGVSYEGFLNRNVNLSMSIAQLSRGKDRERDITKGWKPYKAVLREGKLYFYKPSGALVDELRALFPTSLVVGDGASDNLPAFGEKGISADDIKRNMLATRDLLAATSDSDGGIPSSTGQKIGTEKPVFKRNPSDRPSVAQDASTEGAPRSWERPGRHSDLKLSLSKEEPPSWSARVLGGSLDALAHEFVFATQASSTPSLEDAGAYLNALLYTQVFRAQRPLQSLLVALHKWAGFAITDQETESRRTLIPSRDEEFKEHLRQRMALAADPSFVNLADEEGRSSITHFLQDIASDCASGLVNEAEYASLGVAPSLVSAKDDAYPARADIHGWEAASGLLSPDQLLTQDPNTIAKQLHAFHIDGCAAFLAIAQNPPTAALLISHASDNSLGRQLSLVCFDWRNPHFLTRLVWDHILGSANPHNQGAANAVQAAKERASLLRHWIAVASYLLKLKNVPGWLGICAALCSCAVSRLSTTWRFVATSDRTLVSSYWAPVLAKLGWSEISEPRVRPFMDNAGSIKASINAAPSILSHDTLPYFGNAVLAMRRLGPLENTMSGYIPLADALSAAKSLWSLNSQLKTIKAPLNLRTIQGKDQRMQQAFSSMLQAHTAEHFDASTCLTQSMQLEPPVLGHAGHSLVSPLPKDLAMFAMSPLVYQEALPNLTLVRAEDITPSKVQGRNAASPEYVSLHTAPDQDTNPHDNDATITQRSTSRPALAGGPLLRSNSLTASLPLRSMKGVPFGDVLEWTPGLQAGLTPSGDNHVLRLATDLIFMISSEPALSLPSSPATGKRFSQEFASRSSSRPSSHASRRSSLPPSERNSFIEPVAAPMQVSIKAASLERLIDVLVMGVQHLPSSAASDDSNEKQSLPGQRRQRLSIDMPLHRKVFLATYRSYCSPILLFEHLRKRLLAAFNAGCEMALPAQHRPLYPTWPRVEPVGLKPQQIDWSIVSKVRQGVVGVLSAWISEYPYDLVENRQLYEGVHTLADDLITSGTRHIDDMDIDKSLRALDDLVQQLRLAVMTSQSERKVSKRSSKRASARLPLENQSSGNATIDIDTVAPSDLVDYLESVVRVFFDKVDEMDLLQVYELFNGRSNDAFAWHVARYSEAAQHQAPEELPAVNSMYKLLELLRWPHDSRPLVQRLPASIRDACAAQNLLRGWTAIQIIEDDIGLQRRQARICKLIDAVWICRARMCNSRLEEFATSPLSPGLVFQEPTIASFVESVIVGSLTSSESRLFIRAWQGAALERGTTCDQLAGFAPSREACDQFREATQANSTPDVGWLLKSIAQAVTRVSDWANGGSALLDFDKFRTVFALIKSSVGRTKNGTIDPAVVELAGERLAAMQNALRCVTWDRRQFKHNNAREMADAPPLAEATAAQPRHGMRPLLSISTLQQNKYRRDRYAYEQILAHLRRDQREAAAASQQPAGLPRLAETSPSPRVLQPQQMLSANTSEKKTRRMTALFRGAVRPMGLMSSSPSPSGQDRSLPDLPAHTSEELLSMTPTTQKSAFVTTCGSSRVSVWTNQQRSFVFNLSPPEGGHVLLQAQNQRELNDWMRAIEGASKEYNASHAASTGPGSADMAKKGSNGGFSAAKGDRGPSVALYDTDIMTLAEHEKRAVPLGLERMLEQVEARGLREQGIYRISGAKSAIEALKLAFSSQPAETVNLTTGELSDIHTIAGAIKQWFRDLPNPAIPFSAYHAIIAAERMDGEEERLYAIRDIIWEFPRPHFELLKRICEHLALVCDEGDHNLMAPHNIGLVFGTSLLNPPPGPAAVAESFGNIGKAAHIVKILVTMHDWLFESEQEQEQEQEQEDEQGDREMLADGAHGLDVDQKTEKGLKLSSVPAIHSEEPQQLDEEAGAPQSADEAGAPQLEEERKQSHEHEFTVDGDVDTDWPTDHLESDSRPDGITAGIPSHLSTIPAVVEPTRNQYLDFLSQSSQSSESSMLQAVMSAHENPGFGSNSLDTKSAAAAKRARRRESVISGQLSPSISVNVFDQNNSSGGAGGAAGLGLGLPSPSSPRAVFDLPEVDEDEEGEDGIVESVQTKDATSGLPAQLPLQPVPSAGDRRSRIESVYLDAKDAIAVLQDPFDEEEEEENSADEEGNGETAQDSAITPSTPSPITIEVAEEHVESASAAA